jgi:group I intron endonuclease
MASGIYSISAPSGKRYIGSAVNIARRWKAHRSALRNNRHQNAALQRACDKYGIDALHFAILEHCDAARLIEREQFHIDSQDWDQLYNLAPQAAGGSGPHTPETRARMSTTSKAKLADLDFRHARTLASLAAWASPERNEKIAAKLRGRPKSETHRQQLAVARAGIKDSAETRAKKGAARLGWRAQVPYAGNTSGYVGVRFHQAAQKWTAVARLDGKNKHLGCFASAELAHEYRQRWLAAQEAS